MFIAPWFKQWLAAPRHATAPSSSPLTTLAHGTNVIPGGTPLVLGPFTTTTPKVLLAMVYCSDLEAFQTMGWNTNNTGDLPFCFRKDDPGLDNVSLLINNNTGADKTVRWVISVYDPTV